MHTKMPEHTYFAMQFKPVLYSYCMELSSKMGVVTDIKPCITTGLQGFVFLTVDCGYPQECVGHQLIPVCLIYSSQDFLRLKVPYMPQL